MERDTLSLPLGSSQWYTTSLTPISSTPPSEKEQLNISTTVAASATTPVFELTEEVFVSLNASLLECLLHITVFFFQLTPKRPLRSEIEREKRLSRPTSIITTISSRCDEGSNRNSIGKIDDHLHILT